MRTLTEAARAALTPQSALSLLKGGNERFQTNLKYNRNLLEQANETAGGQFPFAVILSCMDSRTSVELVFDQGLGDIFSIRIAGNVLNGDILGSMEFACALAGTKLIVVLGHSSCGAVKGACDGARLGHLTEVLEKIGPAVAMGRAEKLEGGELVQRVAEHNVNYVVDQVRERSPALSKLIAEGKVGIVGGMYQLTTGTVTFGELRTG